MSASWQEADTSVRVWLDGLRLKIGPEGCDMHPPIPPSPKLALCLPPLGAHEVHVPHVDVQVAQASVQGKAETKHLLFAVPARIAAVVHDRRRTGLVPVPHHEALRVGIAVPVGLVFGHNTHRSLRQKEKS